jgi:hypothetical protein
MGRSCYRLRSIGLEFHKRFQVGEVVAEIGSADVAIGSDGHSRWCNKVGDLRRVRDGWTAAFKTHNCLNFP